MKIPAVIAEPGIPTTLAAQRLHRKVRQRAGRLKPDGVGGHRNDLVAYG